VGESPEEKEVLAKLDEAARKAAWDEFDKEAARERWGMLPLRMFGLGFARGPLAAAEQRRGWRRWLKHRR
jgi:hypothetical protein